YGNGLIIAGFIIFHIISAADAFAGPHHLHAPCRQACPARINVPAYTGLIADRRFEEAKAVIKRRMPFASVCGTICSAPCEVKCVRSSYDSSVMIMNLKKTTAEYEESSTIPLLSETRRRAAIVGAGPGGLSLAHFLSRFNIHSSLFEKESEPGGLLRYGIPSFRIDILDILMDIENILSSDLIELHTDTEVGKDISMDELEKEFDYIVLASGNNQYVCPDRDIMPQKDVYPGLLFLRMIAEDNIPEIGHNAGIIGGGNVAMDVARSLVRLGARATVFYRNSAEYMKASEDEIEEAIEEGVNIKAMHSVESVDNSSGSLIVTFRDKTQDKTVDYGLSSLFYATGQEMTLDYCTRDIRDKGGFKTNFPNIFILRDSGTIVETVRNAQVIASFINRKTRPFSSVLFNWFGKIDYSPVLRKIPDGAFNYRKPKHVPRIDLINMDIEDRKNSFFKTKRDLTSEESVSQAKRCLRCHLKMHLPFDPD
ncbi:MAG: FAD-dependent oxidoreductase, partial [candidate division WOR-3 bacterium]|nr:FAD-dependent oxidoreductase [candidate division WOR-3 bacterium]